jgi:hypothetical protein
VTEGLWEVQQFRHSDQQAWDALRSTAITLVQPVAEAALLEELAEAPATFAAAHPDAHRLEPDEDALAQP